MPIGKSFLLVALCLALQSCVELSSYAGDGRFNGSYRLAESRAVRTTYLPRGTLRDTLQLDPSASDSIYNFPYMDGFTVRDGFLEEGGAAQPVEKTDSAIVTAGRVLFEARGALLILNACLLTTAYREAAGVGGEHDVTESESRADRCPDYSAVIDNRSRYDTLRIYEVQLRFRARP